jgi:GrpB-like predicted nucleotidyltransferase (UPF0157 family)
MPAPIPVELVPHDPAWADLARHETARLTDALGENLLVVHHIGSTAVPGIRAKPIVDLLPVVRSLAMIDRAQAAVEALGYVWWGELGLAGRRYCTLTDRVTGQRRVQLHCFEDGSPAIERHVAFRDYLLSHPDLAQAYDREKARCRDLNPGDSHAYTECKDTWIKRIEQEAIAFVRSDHGESLRQ